MLKHFTVLLLVITLGWACQKEISLDPGSGNTAAPVKATVSGQVLDETGQPMAGVSVRAGNSFAITDAKGFFRMPKASLDRNASVVIAEKSGYFKGIRSFQATSGANFVQIKLIPKHIAGTVNASAGGAVSLSNGATVALPASAIVKAAGGTPYTGTVRVYAAYIDPAAADIGQVVPGSFMADDKNGKRSVLLSYGMMAVELESDAGEKLQIASGKEATLSTPIPAAATGAPASIPLWYLDEQTGIWKEEGSAVKQGNVYIGAVKHFSFWNCDAGFPGINLSMRLTNSHGTPYVNTTVRLTRSGSGWNTVSYGFTDSLGYVSGLVPSGESIILDVMDDCRQVVYTSTVGPFAVNTNLGTLVVTASSGAVEITGTVTNCAGNPLAGAMVIVEADGWPRYVTSDAAGHYSLSILHCASSSPTCTITAIDNVAGQQATQTGITIVSPATDAGTIAACGTSTSQFINFTFDGQTYSLTTAVSADSLFFNSSPQAGGYINHIIGNNFAAGVSFALRYNSPAIATGTYTPDYISIQNFTTGTVVIPTSIVITSITPASGGFAEGSFSGSYRDDTAGAALHTFSGNFRLRRY